MSGTIGSVTTETLPSGTEIHTLHLTSDARAGLSTGGSLIASPHRGAGSSSMNIITLRNPVLIAYVSGCLAMIFSTWICVLVGSVGFSIAATMFERAIERARLPEATASWKRGRR